MGLHIGSHRVSFHAIKEHLGASKDKVANKIKNHFAGANNISTNAPNVGEGTQNVRGGAVNPQVTSTLRVNTPGQTGDNTRKFFSQPMSDETRATFTEGCNRLKEMAMGKNIKGEDGQDKTDKDGNPLKEANMNGEIRTPMSGLDKNTLDDFMGVIKDGGVAGNGAGSAMTAFLRATCEVQFDPEEGTASNLITTLQEKIENISDANTQSAVRETLSTFGYILNQYESPGMNMKEFGERSIASLAGVFVPGASMTPAQSGVFLSTRATADGDVGRAIIEYCKSLAPNAENVAQNQS